MLWSAEGGRLRVLQTETLRGDAQMVLANRPRERERMTAECCGPIEAERMGPPKNARKGE